MSEAHPVKNRKRARWERYPFVVHFREEVEETYIWTGTVLSPCYILTAAHSCFDSAGNQTVDIETLTLSFFPGDRQRKGSDQIYCNIYRHPLYKATKQNDPICFDAAILKLKVPIDVGEYPSVRVLDRDSARGDQAEAKSAIVVGWNYDVPDKLWEFPIDVSPLQRPIGSLPCLFEGYADGRKGDSGGPLLVRRGSKWNQVGIHSSRDCSTGRCELTRLAHPSIQAWMDTKNPSC